MHTMQGSSEQDRSSLYLHPSTSSSYHGLKSASNTIQYFYSLTQHKTLTENAVVHQLNAMHMNTTNRRIHYSTWFRWIRRYVDKVDPYSLNGFWQNQQEGGVNAYVVLIIEYT